MTLEEFRQLRRQQEESKKFVPTLYADVFEHYSLYKMLREKNRCKLDILYYELEGVKAVDYTKEKGTYNNDARIEKYYRISDDISQLEKENTIIDNVLSGLEYIRDRVKEPSLRAKIEDGYFKTFI